MTIYNKRISVGAFLKKGEDIKADDIITIASEGKKVQGEFGEQDIFLVKLKDGREGNLSFNTTSINNCIDAYGEDSLNWIGKTLKVWAIRMAVQGKIKLVYFFAHPNAEINDNGEFFLEVSVPKKKSKKVLEQEDDIPIIEDELEQTNEDFKSAFEV